MAGKSQGIQNPSPRPPEGEASLPDTTPLPVPCSRRAADAGQSRMENLNVMPQPLPRGTGWSPEDITFQPSSTTHPWPAVLCFPGLKPLAAQGLAGRHTLTEFENG